jgi:hypothetical protein
VSLRSDHYDAIKAALQSLTSLEIYDTVAPLNSDGTVRKASYYVLHDLGASKFSDQRFTSTQAPASTRMYRYVLRSVGTTPFASRENADVGLGLVGKTLTVLGRKIDPIQVDSQSEPSPDPATGTPLVWWNDTDFIVWSRRA